MIFVWFFDAVSGLVEWVVSQLPVIDWTLITDRLSGISRIMGWVMQLNAFFPVVETMAAFTALFAVWSVLYGVMLTRRIFSLFWPGAGS